MLVDAIVVPTFVFCFSPIKLSVFTRPSVDREETEEVNFVDKEFLHKQINNKDVYMWIMV